MGSLLRKEKSPTRLEMEAMPVRHRTLQTGIDVTRWPLQVRKRRRSSDGWESEGVMLRENVQISTKLSMAPVFEGPERRTLASYERELTEHRDTEIRLRQALAEHQTLLVQKDEAIRQQEVLNQECHHRLLNNLQMIVGLLSLQSRTEADAEAASRLAVAAKRVGAIARLHRHLHPMDGRQTVEFKEYLDELCRDHSTMSMSQDRPDQVIVVDGIELRLPTGTAIPLGLIVNELVTNAIKHGKGEIAVKLEPHSRKGHALSVCNKGSALPEGFDPMASRGLGMSLVSALAKQIGGELRIDRGDKNDCTRFTVFFA
jgi:two-component system, sensor histidine kinase PdtaS